MEYYVTDKNIGSDRFGVNKSDTQEFLPSYKDMDVFSYLYELGYRGQKLEAKVVNFLDNKLKRMSVVYNKPEDIRDYVCVLANDGTPMLYYPALDEPQIGNKQQELITVQYVMDEWCTYYFMKVAVQKANINVLHKLKFKNRGKKNPRINTNRDDVEVLIFDDAGKPQGSEGTSREYGSFESEYYMTNPHILEHQFSTTEYVRSFRVKVDFNEIWPMKREGTEEEDRPTHDPDFGNFNVDTTFEVHNTEFHTIEKHFHCNRGLSNWDMDLVIRIDMGTENDIQKVKYSVQFNSGHQYSPNVVDTRAHGAIIHGNARVQIWYDDQYVPPVDPTDDETQNNFYVDYQEQPGHNRKLNEENIELLPIEKKEYTHDDLYHGQFEKYSQQETNFDWKNTINVESAVGSSSRDIPILSQNESTMFNAPKIDYNHNSEQQTYETNITSINVSDEIFNNNGMYTYVVCKPSGMCSLVTGSYSADKDMNTRNIGYLVPVAKMKIKPKTTPVLGGQNNAGSTLKQLSTIGTSSAVTTTFSLPIPPTLIGLRSKSTIKYLGDTFDENDPTLVATLGNWVGLYDYNYVSDNGTFEHIGVIPVTTETVKMFLDNNRFMTMTQEGLNRMNQHIYDLPTTNENEPFLYSPNCLLTGIIAQNDNQAVGLGNDYLNLQYTLNNIGLECLFLNNATLNYSANRLSETRVISNSRNELAFSVGLPLPVDSSAYTEGLNGNANTESTSWKVYQNNHNLRIIQGTLSGFDAFFNGPAKDFGLGTLITPGQSIAKSVSRMLGGGSETAGRILQDQNEKLRLKSQYNNIKASSGTNVSMPSYCASCFAGDRGLVIYTNFIREDLIDDVLNNRRSNGVPLDMVLPFNYYDNRKRFNVLAIDTNYNYLAIKKAIKDNLKCFLTEVNDYYIDDFIENYLTGVRLFKGEYGVPYEITDNYENNMGYDR